MSNATREINRITTAIIRISVKLIVYALIILLLYEAVTKGFAFGHEIFYAEAVEEAPGRDKTITIEPDTSVNEAARLLADDGLIGSEFAFIFQSKFYDYDTIYPGVYNLNTSMTSKEILQALNVKPEGEKETEDQKGTARLKTTDGTAAPASAEAQKANAGAQSAAGDDRKADGGSEAAGDGQAAARRQATARRRAAAQAAARRPRTPKARRRSRMRPGSPFRRASAGTTRRTTWMRARGTADGFRTLGRERTNDCRPQNNRLYFITGVRPG